MARRSSTSKRSSRRKDARLELEQLEGRKVPARAGAIDPTFAAGGVFLPGSGASLHAVAVQPDGRVVAAGQVTGPDGTDFLVVRLDPDGAPDPSFGTAGRVTVDFTGVAGPGSPFNTEEATAVALMPDGRIVVGGTGRAWAVPNPSFLAARLTPAGQLDPAFDGDGRAAVTYGPSDPGPSTFSGGMAVDALGRVVAVGAISTVVGSAAEVIRLTAAGQLDPAFDGDGRMLPRPSRLPTDQEFGNAVAVQPDGRVVAVGTLTVMDPPRARGFVGGWAIRVNEDGSPGGWAGPGLTRATAVAVMADGRVVAGGDKTDVQVLPGGSPGPADFGAGRRLPDGAADPAFGPSGDGTTRLDLGADDRVAAVAVGPDGRVVLAGFGATDFPVVRVNADGTPDGGFNAALGAADLARFGGSFSATGVALQGDAVIVAGSGVVTRLLGSAVPEPLAVSGVPNGSAAVFAPAAATGQYATTPAATLSPFGNTGMDLRVAVGDVDGDLVPDTVLVTGPGVPLRVAVVSGADAGTVLVAPFDPFGGDFPGGGFVAAGDFDHDGKDEIVVTPGRGGGPRVTIFSLLPTGLTQRANYFTLNPDFRGGARAAVGDVSGDGTPDLAVAAGAGGGPQVTLIDGTKALTTDGFNPTDRLVGDFFAFDAALRNGAYVAIGDVDGDGFGDLVFGAGLGGAPRVLTVSGKQLMSQGAVVVIAAPLSNFFVAGNTSDRGGVRVAAVTADGDDRADVAVGTGEGSVSRVRVYLGKDFGGAEPAVVQDLDPFAGVTLANGVFVG
jgi:uncharacterized delta-60 repeat protein